MIAILAVAHVVLFPLAQLYSTVCKAEELSSVMCLVITKFGFSIDDSRSFLQKASDPALARQEPNTQQQRTS